MSYYLDVAEQEFKRGNTGVASVITELYDAKVELERLVVVTSQGRDLLFRENEILKNQLERAKHE